MKIALDPFMIRHLPLPDQCRVTAELGYEHIELSPRSDFLDGRVMPRATGERFAAFRQAETSSRFTRQEIRRLADRRGLGGQAR